MDDLTALTKIKPSSADGKAILPALLNIFQVFQDKFASMFEDLREDMSKIISTQDAKIAELKDEVVQLNNKITKLEDKLDDNDNYERRDTLVFSGNSLPQVHESEVCSELIPKLVKDTLHVNISPADISTAHRLITRKNTDKRDIIVKFCRRNCKVDILKACRTVKPPNFFANEHLTPQRQTIAYVLRKCKRQFPHIISGTTTIEGKNYVWLKPPNPAARGARDTRMAINTHSRLVDFCNKSLNTPLSTFISEWNH